ncbi:Chromo domain containing protein [Quillaja saponaria]|uniref:Chromo domain containing protein n=1 Tax=Quillaja saponaria TaxID=32244 RepID=A0AAD7Q801_QUISA|nr:Chromo domain containing protein [Quillaja saponaria]
MFLKVSPFKGIMQFGKKGKLSLRFIGPFQILDMVGTVAYRLSLPPDLDRMHPIFHVSMLQKYLPDESHILRIQEVQVDKDLTYEEQLVEIIDKQVRKLRSKVIPLVKVIWQHHGEQEATWESKNEMKQRYPYLFE